MLWSYPANLRAHLPPLDPVTGACVHLADDNRCRRYHNRPPICRLDEWRQPGMTASTWRSFAARACNRLQAQLGAPGHFRLRP